MVYSILSVNKINTTFVSKHHVMSETLHQDAGSEFTAILCDFYPKPNKNPPGTLENPAWKQTTLICGIQINIKNYWQSYVQRTDRIQLKI